ncbi:alpha/beta fold hydrolase [Streptomyces sp. NPDC007157]|uniref:alpha/beta fold hydrolase n=1 Tax=Streptomyces sp. NPDC007157 TaxID=3154681 RepID=UPI00340FC3CF
MGESEGPLALAPAFPECWYNRHHQFTPSAQAGYHVVAPDQPVRARSDRPAAVEEYTTLHIVGDIIGLIHALGTQQAVVIDHDLGSGVAWSTALMRPDAIDAVRPASVEQGRAAFAASSSGGRSACRDSLNHQVGLPGDHHAIELVEGCTAQIGRCMDPGMRAGGFQCPTATCS